MPRTLHESSHLADLRLCELLGLDPATTTGIAITIEPGSHPVATWSGGRRVTPKELAALVDAFEEGDCEA